MHIKICGVESVSDFLLLERNDIDFGGMWWQVPGGRYNLSVQQLKLIVAAASGRTRPMLVTLGAPLDDLIGVLLRTGMRAVQLHGFELPGAVRRLKAAVADAMVFKVLHVRDGLCLEAKLIDAYRQAGVDVFIVDTFLSRAAAGSTGVPVDMAVVEALLAAAQGIPVMLAGGVSAQRIIALHSTSGLWGLDIDSAARIDGKIAAGPVAALTLAVRELAAREATPDAVLYTGDETLQEFAT